MMSKLILAPNRQSISVWDGEKTVAKARKLPNGGWLLINMGGCWMHPKARVPSAVTGSVTPNYYEVRTRLEAIKELTALVIQTMAGKVSEGDAA